MSIVCKEITSESEKIIAQNIVKEEYLKSGYIASRESAIPSSEYLRKDTSCTFGLFSQEKIVGTISIIFDSEKGIPMDALFRDRLDSFRQRNEKVAEVTQLAIDDAVFLQLPFLQKKIERLHFLTLLFRAILQSAEKAERSALCIMVNPKHSSFYDHIGFQNIGDTQLYACLQNAPAVPKILLLQEIQKHTVKNTFLKTLLKKSQ